MLPTTMDTISRKQFDVIVVGGGAAGCATTYNLAKAGVKVALLEKYDLNTQASGRNAGSLHGQIQFEPFDELGDEWAKNFLPGLNFLAESLKMWKTLSNELKVDLEVGGNGGLMVAQTSSDMLALARKIELENSIGINSRLIDRNELKEKAPYISQSMLGAAFCPIEGKANPLTTAPAFAARAQEMGAEIHTGIEVFEISKESSKFHFKTSNGEFVATEKFVNHLIYFTTEKLTFKQANSGSLLIGGGWPAKYKNNGEPTFNIDSLQSNLKVALKVCPSISKINLIRTWIGVGNGTPDHNPIIGMVPNTPGAYIGMYPYMGFTASPLMGQVLTELVVNGTSSVDLKPFSPQRF